LETPKESFFTSKARLSFEVYGHRLARKGPIFGDCVIGFEIFSCLGHK
jgi:hypothetical protein